MEHRDRLKALTDDELLMGLSRVVAKRNQITAEFLTYLAELDERQLFLDLGHPSLFAYCVEVLGLCESTAGRHIAAARVCRSHAHAFELVAHGDLHASALSLMRKHITAENAAELFELCTQKSARQVEELLAARFPRPDVRDLIRRLPVPACRAPNVGSAADLNGLAKQPAPEVGEASKSESRPREHGPSGHSEAAKARRLEPLSTDRYGVHFTADGEFRDLLERVRGFAGHRLPNGDLLTLLKRGLSAYERELEKGRFAIGSQPRASKSLGKRTRHCAAAVAREVFVRDEKQCSYVSPEGRRCGSRLRLELDHIQPWALGGHSGAANLRLRCRAHNQRYARQCFGEVHQRAAQIRQRDQARPAQQ